MSPAKSKKGDSTKWIVSRGTFLGTSLLAVVLGIVLVTLGWQSGHRQVVLLPPTTTPPTTSPGIVVSGTSIGFPRAPITIVAYSDFQCHFCEQFANTIESQIDATYIQTGKVRFVYKHLISFGEESQLAAEASEAAAEQNQFWPFHDALMRLQLSNAASDLSLEKLRAIAQQLGLNMTQFDAGLTSGKFKAKVASDDAEGRATGITGIPAFFVNGIKAPDGVSTSFEEFQKVLDAELARLGK